MPGNAHTGWFRCRAILIGSLGKAVWNSEVYSSFPNHGMVLSTVKSMPWSWPCNAFTMNVWDACASKMRALTKPSDASTTLPIRSIMYHCDLFCPPMPWKLCCIGIEHDGDNVILVRKLGSQARHSSMVAAFGTPWTSIISSFSKEIHALSGFPAVHIPPARPCAPCSFICVMVCVR